MPYFALSYRILFHDTMAYGTHHHMANFKFQNQAREILLFETKMNGKESWRDQLSDIVMLTREAHSLNLGPANLGDKVGILLTYEEPSRSTVRLCFRVIRQDGLPISCGYQTLVLIDKETQEPIQAPPMMTQYLNTYNKSSLLENLKEPSFKDRVLEGGKQIKEIFSRETIELGKYIANASGREVYPKIIDEDKKVYTLGSEVNFPVGENKLVFTFPGQGSYHYKVLKEIYESYPESITYFRKADEITRQNLKKEFLPLLQGSSQIEHDMLLSEYPELNQVGIYLTEVLIAKFLLDQGMKPDLLVGHSFGEIAALATGGAISLEEGIHMVCERILALRAINAEGRMGAAFCDAPTAEKVLKEFEPHALEIAVCNHAKQTVLSGPLSDLEKLRGFVAPQGISITIIDSKYPFHSSFLRPAVGIFEKSLKKYHFKKEHIPIYHCTERVMYSMENNNAKILANQFTERLEFNEIVQILYDTGYRKFIECGGGDIVSKLVLKNLRDKEDIIAVPSALPGQRFSEIFDHVVKKINPRARKSEVEDQGAFNIPLKPSSHEDRNIVNRVSLDQKEPISAASPTEECPEMPIAVVSMGCVLPGAKDPQQYWENIKNGISGIIDLADIDPGAKSDFMAGKVEEGINDIVPDKTYTLLNGSIIDIKYEPDLLASNYKKEEFNSLTRGQKLLALALAQNLSVIKDALHKLSTERIQCILGATADGSSEYDQAIFLESVLKALEDRQEPTALRQRFASGLEEIFGYKKGDAGNLKQTSLYNEIIDRLLGPNTDSYILDSACSSSLYAIDAGIKALRDQRVDLVLAGGVFAPGPANNTLFAQFRGLTPSSSRPFDEAADGVIFGDGAAMIGMKRLDDSLKNNDEILGVIRGIGLSSDGKSPSINVPQSKGQILAMRKAYSTHKISIDSIQYVEAHATSTPVGDAVEVNAIKGIMEKRNPGLPKVGLGSVKALVGHTGWASGVASVIKMIKALEEQLVPRQHHYNKPNKNIDLRDSALTITTKSHDWPSNIHGYPRRAGINGFGFGGTNAHLILEEFDRVYHQDVITQNHFVESRTEEIAIIGIGSLFPAVTRLEKDQPTDSTLFLRDKLHLPAKKILLPDIAEQMDITQYLAALASEKILQSLPENLKKFKDTTGVVIGLESKTEQGVKVNERIFIDQLKRKVALHGHKINLTEEERTRMLNDIIEHFKAVNAPSGPYTLPGLMPNLAAGRVTNMFDLKGPNIVVDKGEYSLFQALILAEQFLLHGDSNIIFAGGINALGEKNETTHQEAAFLLALTKLKVARENNLPILCTIKISPLPHQIIKNKVSKKGHLPMMGAQGALELQETIKIVQQDKLSKTIIVDFDRENQLQLDVKPYSAGKIEVEDVDNAMHSMGNGKAQAYDNVSGTPIYYHIPKLFEEKAEFPAITIQNRHILFITDQKKEWRELENSGFLDALTYHVLTPEGLDLKNSVSINIESENVIQQTIEVLDTITFDTIIAFKDLKDHAEKSLIDNPLNQEEIFLDLLFAICRGKYESLQKGQLSLVSLCIGAWKKDSWNPYTGLVAGFMKSLSRELQEGIIKTINTDEVNIYKALRQVEIELGQSPYIGEVCYINGSRHIFKLTQIEKLSREKRPYIGENSVVLATGGGRGVTAALVEELLRKYKCTVIGIGRRDLNGVPQEVLEMDEEAFKTYESRFYKENLISKTGNIKELKSLYHAYQAANELSNVIQRFENLPGRFDYYCADIDNEEVVNQLISEIYKKYGRLDLIIHGAGVQISEVLTKKKLPDFRKIISTKLGSLGYLYRATERLQNAYPLHFHLLTSAFSYMGNDGQPDYGAANEAMNRIAEYMDQLNKDTHWSSMAWLGWANIGMTRGSEFAALAANRRLRGITKKEGQKIFSELMEGTPNFPSNIIMADGELKFYHVLCDQTPVINKDNYSFSHRTSSKKELITEWDISLESAPYLRDHTVAGVPTLPAAFIISVGAAIAKELKPHFYVKAFENTHFYKFVRVFDNKTTRLNLSAQVLTENESETAVRIQMKSDFIHKSGLVLQKDILHYESVIKMSKQKPVADRKHDIIKCKGELKLPDPYVLPGSVVHLQGHFDGLNDIFIASNSRRAKYKLNRLYAGDAKYDYLVPNLTLVDAFWRFGTVNLSPENMLPIYVPEECRIMRVYFDFTDFNLDLLHKPLVFTGANPEADGDFLKVGPIQVVDDQGNVLLEVEGGICRNFGEVKKFEKTKNELV